MNQSENSKSQTPRQPSDSLPKAKRMLEQLYNRHGAGCCLHIVTDDGNIRDSDVTFCIGYAQQHNCVFCEEFAVVLEELGELGRAHLLNMKVCEDHGYTLYDHCGIGGCSKRATPLPAMERVH